MKKAENITIIGHADGPTSIFLVGKVHGGKRNLRYSYIGRSASGSKKKMKKFKKWKKALWRYYGVTQEDIDKKISQYKDVVRALTG